MKGGVVEVGKMIGSADPANGSVGAAVWGANEVGVGAMPHREGEAPQADIIQALVTRIAKSRFMMGGIITSGCAES
jgi:hypothetical protein